MTGPLFARIAAKLSAMRSRELLSITIPMRRPYRLRSTALDMTAQFQTLSGAID
jgi:hypothetical protein